MLRNLLPLFLYLAACVQDVGDARGVRLADPAPRPAKRVKFDHRESAALFVGVRNFAESELNHLRYTVDDAVDLAYTMAFDRKVQLVLPRNVVIAISGPPVKPESQQRLQLLRNSGATVIERVDRETIAEQLAEQVQRTGDAGLLILFFASHGFTSDGIGYVLASDSLFGVPRSSLSVAKIHDAAAARPRSLIFVDACRERIPAGSRGPVYEAGGAAPLIERMKPVEGQAFFYAAAPGQWAFEDPRKRNGVFTSAVIDALRTCKAPKNRGFITVETLAERLEERVRDWLKDHKDTHVTKATQVLMDAQTKEMPLAFCGLPPNPEAVAADGASFTAFGKGGEALWSRRIENQITVQRIVDLDDDKYNEVVLADAAGNVTVYTSDGERLWFEKTARGFSVESLHIDYLAGKTHKRHIVARSTAADDSTSVISIFTADGTQIGHYEHTRRVVAVVIDRTTATHDPRIIAADTSSVFLLDRKAERKWLSSSVLGRITSLRTIDIDNDKFRDIEVRTTAGKFYLNFSGNTLILRK